LDSPEITVTAPEVMSEDTINVGKTIAKALIVVGLTGYEAAELLSVFQACIIRDFLVHAFNVPVDTLNQEMVNAGLSSSETP
jgi:hypothetical protein